MATKPRPLGNRAEQHRRMAMERIEQAKRQLKTIRAEATLLATTRMTTEAVQDRARHMIEALQDALLELTEAEKALLEMRAVASDE